VLCEKPLVTTYREADQLVTLARENHTFLMEALWTRCMPVLIEEHHASLMNALARLVSASPICSLRSMMTL